MLLWLEEGTRAEKGRLGGKKNNTKVQLSAGTKRNSVLLDGVVVSETDDETGLPSTRTAARASTYTADHLVSRPASFADRPGAPWDKVPSIVP